MVSIIHGPADANQSGSRDGNQEQPGFQRIPSPIPNPHLYDRMRPGSGQYRALPVPPRASHLARLTASSKQGQVPHSRPTETTVTGRETPEPFLKLVGPGTDRPACEPEQGVRGVIERGHASGDDIGTRSTDGDLQGRRTMDQHRKGANVRKPLRDK
jgi:hypothetical protein